MIIVTTDVDGIRYYTGTVNGTPQFRKGKSQAPEIYEPTLSAVLRQVRTLCPDRKIISMDSAGKIDKARFDREYEKLTQPA